MKVYFCYLQRCVVVQEVFPDGLIAQDGRLRPGDQIIEINGVDMTCANHLQVNIAIYRYTIQYHSGLGSRELGQAPMLQVFLAPRQALSSYKRQHLSTPRFPQCDHTVGKLSADACLLCSEV